MRAIILAAGKGSRLWPLTERVPKPLVEVLGKPIIERQIECLLSKGIKEIIVVVGYLKERFYYLRDKYNVKLLYNDKFDKFNNIYSMYIAREYLRDTYVIEGDVFINENFIIPNIRKSTYFPIKKKNFKNEWVVLSDSDNIVKEIQIRNGKNEYILSGVSYVDEETGNFIVNKIIDKIERKKQFKNLYWDNIVLENLQRLNFQCITLEEYESFEIDTVEDLNLVQASI
ncbi:MAG: sugar phosphate nucleotidyltransferase [Clostridium sp.]